MCGRDVKRLGKLFKSVSTSRGEGFSTHDARKLLAVNAPSVPGPRSWFNMQFRNSASFARSNGFVSASATMSVVRMSTCSMMYSIYSRLTSMVAHSKYLVRCEPPTLMIMCLAALQSVRRTVGPYTSVPMPTKTRRTLTVSFVALPLFQLQQCCLV